MNYNDAVINPQVLTVKLSALQPCRGPVSSACSVGCYHCFSGVSRSLRANQMGFKSRVVRLLVLSPHSNKGFGVQACSRQSQGLLRVLCFYLSLSKIIRFVSNSSNFRIMFKSLHHKQAEQTAFVFCQQRNCSLRQEFKFRILGV